MRLVADAFPDFFRRSPEADDQRVGFQGREIFRIRWQTAPGGYDGFYARRKFLHDLFFQCPERRFSFLGENIRDGATGARLDQFIRVEKFKAEIFRHLPADGGFAGAHETDERDIGGLAADLHGDELAEKNPGRTPDFFWCSQSSA